MDTVYKKSPISDDALIVRNISWPAIFGGVVVAITFGLLLNLLGTALGFASFEPDMDVAKTLSTSAMIWIFAAGIISMFLAGWVASKLSGLNDALKGYWQGFIVAGVTTLLMLYVATTAIGTLIGGSFNIIGKVVSASSSAVGSTVSGASELSSTLANANVSKDDIAAKLKNSLPASLSPLIDQLSFEADNFSDAVEANVDSQAPSAGDVEAKAKAVKAKAEFYKKKVTPALTNFLQSINTENYDQAKKDLVEALAQASGKSTQDVEAKVAEWQQAYENAKTKAMQAAKDAAKTAADTISHFAFIYFFVILLSIVAAGIGGTIAATGNRASYQ